MATGRATVHSMTLDDGYVQEREALVERMRRLARISDERVLAAFMQVPRHRFLLPSQVEVAYEDRALPLLEQQTISQPSMIAIMLSALHCRPTDRALEVGAGCGYASALLAQLVAEVDAIEIREALARHAARTLEILGISNVRIHVGDGGRGLPERAPFDRILVSAGATSIPRALIEQLAPGGRIAIPVGDDVGQTLLVGERGRDGKVTWEPSVPCMFVPLVCPS